MSAEGEQKRVDSRGAGSVQCSSNAASTGDSIPHAVSAAGPAEPRGWAGSARIGVPALAGCREGAGLTAAGLRHSGCQRAALAREGLLGGTERRLRGPWNSAPLLSLAKQEVGHFISDPVAFAARKVFSRGRGFFLSKFRVRGCSAQAMPQTYCVCFCTKIAQTTPGGCMVLSPWLSILPSLAMPAGLLPSHSSSQFPGRPRDPTL